MRLRLSILLGALLALMLSACGGPTPRSATSTPAGGVPTNAQPQEGYPVSTPVPTLPSGAYPPEPVEPAATAPSDAYPPATQAAALPTEAAPAGDTPAPTATPAATAAPAFITYGDFTVNPASTTIRAGTQVTFLIRDSIHQPYAGAAAPFIFEAPPGLEPGSSWSYSFNQAGTFTLLCGYHSTMNGTLVVQP